MRDDEIRRILTTANPWWKTTSASGDPTGWTKSHRVLAERRQHDRGYRATVLADVVAHGPDGSLTVLTGPRRIGKSVTIIDAIANICAAGTVDLRQIIHVPCDGMEVRDLRRTLTIGRAITGVADREQARPRIWFFDEISSIRGWSAALKQARDQTEFGGDTIVATGSRWVSDEDVQGNLIAGRAGSAAGHRIRQLLPMTFREFAATAKIELPSIVTAHPADLQNPKTKAELAELTFFVDELDLAWQQYLTAGGFPRAVSEHLHDGAVSNAYVRDLVAWLRADVDPDTGTDSVELLLNGICTRMTSPMNIQRASEDLNYSSRPVFELRIQRLVNCHAAIRCHQFDARGRRAARTQSKLYLTDPLLGWLPSLSSPGLPEPDFTALSEAALATALARKIDDLDEGRWVADDTVGYARTSTGNEVDLAPTRVPTTAGSGMTAPIESKWVDSGWRGDARTIRAKYGRGIVATKSILDTGTDVWAVPAPVVALLIA